MHRNANMTYQAQETERLFKTITAISPSKSATGGAAASDQIVLQYCETLNNPEVGIPNIIRLEEIKEELMFEDERKLKPSMTTVLLQEIERFNSLLLVIQDSLEKLVSAISGTIIMSAVLDNVYFSLVNNQVPQLWTSNAYPSLKPLYSWVKDLGTRVEFMKKWVKGGNPTKYMLPYFFFPQGFLTAVLQTYSRKNKTAIDKLKFEFKVVDPEKDSTEEPPEAGGVFIDGLYLEGARWDRKRRSLADQQEGVMYDDMLPIAFSPVEIRELTGKETKKALKAAVVYHCPLYKTTVRAGELSTTGQSTNYVLSISLPTTDFAPSTWVLRGTALICQLND